MPLPQALKVAKEHNLDLVEVAPLATPPVCRLLDYGKYKYQQAKKEREARKAQKASLLREIRLRPQINEHDLDSKIRSIKRLISEGNKVKVTVRFRGREIVRPEMGKQVLRRVLTQLDDLVMVGDAPVMEGQALSLVLLPRGKAEGRKIPNAKA